MPGLLGPSLSLSWSTSLIERGQPILSSPPSQSRMEMIIPPCSGRHSIGATSSLARVLRMGLSHLSARISWNSASTVRESIKQSLTEAKFGSMFFLKLRVLIGSCW